MSVGEGGGGGGGGCGDVYSIHIRAHVCIKVGRGEGVVHVCSCVSVGGACVLMCECMGYMKVK